MTRVDKLLTEVRAMQHRYKKRADTPSRSSKKRSWTATGSLITVYHKLLENASFQLGISYGR